MSKKPKVGGRVQICGKHYTVQDGPSRVGDSDWYRIKVQPAEGFGVYWARSEAWRCGRGPWKIEGPVTGEPLEEVKDMKSWPDAIRREHGIKC